jgi:hypothetical protein
MFASFKRLIIWAVDGRGSSFQGRPALGVAVLLMIVPVALNVLGMYLFGYAPNSNVYNGMTFATLICWAAAGLYMVAVLSFGLYRLGEALLDLFRQFRSERKARNQTEVS